MSSRHVAGVTRSRRSTRKRTGLRLLPTPWQTAMPHDAVVEHVEVVVAPLAGRAGERRALRIRLVTVTFCTLRPPLFNGVQSGGDTDPMLP